MPDWMEENYMDPLTAIRRKKFLETLVSPPVEPVSQKPELTDDLAGVTLNRPALQAYREHVTNMPTGEGLEPSTGRRILAGLTGALTALGSGPGAGSQVANRINTARERDATEKWGRKGAVLKTEADLEGNQYEDMIKYLKMKNDADYKGQMAGYRGQEVANTGKRNELYGKDIESRGQDRLWSEGQKEKELSERTNFHNRSLGETSGWHRSLAGILGRNAASNESRAGTYAKGLGLRERQHDKNENKQISPQASKAASEEALSRVLQTNPDWHDFVTNGQPDPSTAKGGFFSSDKSEEYQNFLSALKDEEKKLLRRRYNNLDEEDDDGDLGWNDAGGR